MYGRLTLLAALCGGTAALVRQAGPRRSLARPMVMSASVPHVKTVSETMRAFEANYPRSIISIWRGPINDMLQVTHLALVDERYKYDVMVGFGFISVMNLLLGKYPVPGEQDKLIDAMIRALDLDVDTIRMDFATVEAWAEGKTEADVLSLPTTTDAGKIHEAYAASVADPAAYLHTRAGNVGFLTLMDKVGCKADADTLTRWTAALGLRKKNVERDALLLKELKEKMNQAMQMVKAMEIREKKRLADTLEAKAKEAQDKASGAAAKA